MNCNCNIIWPAPLEPEEDEPLTPMDAYYPVLPPPPRGSPRRKAWLRSRYCKPASRRPATPAPPWRSVLIRGEARAAWANALQAAMRARDPEEPQALLGRQRPRILSVPLILALDVQIQPGHKSPEIEQMLPVGAAAMTMLNAPHALGFGGIRVAIPMLMTLRSPQLSGCRRKRGLAAFATSVPRPSPALNPVVLPSTPVSANGPAFLPASGEAG